jgi:hypothetical protein
LVVFVVSGCDAGRGSVADCCRGCDHAFVMQWFAWFECCFCWVLACGLAFTGGGLPCGVRCVFVPRAVR